MATITRYGKIISANLLILLLAGTSLFIQAQNPLKGSIKVTITDKMGKGMPFATVELLQAKDSSVVKGGVADEQGKITIETVSTGYYLISTSLVGYSKAYSSRFSVDKENLKIVLPTIMLSHSSGTLSAVTVTSAPLTQQEAGKMIVNVDKSILSAGNTVIEMLQKLPGVTIDQEGDISIKGRTGVLVLINGRRTYLSAADLKTQLSSMSADNVSNVELMDIPPSKYEAEGNAGVININLKKKVKQGLNADLTVGYGQDLYNRHNAGINLNYGTGKLNLFASYSYSRFTNWSEWASRINYYDRSYSTLQSFLQEQTFVKRPSGSHQVSAGFDYTIGKKWTATFQLQETFSNGDFITNKKVDLTHADFKPASSYSTFSTSPRHNRNSTYSGTVQRNLDTSGSKLFFEADYAPFSRKEATHYNTTFYDSLVNFKYSDVLKQDLPALINIKSVQLDYTRVYKLQQAKLEAGVKVYDVLTENESNVYNWRNEKWLPDLLNTNHFIYKEHVNAAYMTYNRSFKQWSFEAGIRGEQTISNANQIQLDSVVKQNYLKVFPTLFIKKPLNKNNVITFSYGKRIRRPDYNQLNPFHTFGDPNQYWAGNPYLRPQISDNFQFSHVYKGKFTTSLTYNHIKDVQVITFRVIPGNIMVVGFDNLGVQNYYAVSFNLFLTPVNWWTFNYTTTGLYTKFKGYYFGEHVNNGYATAQGNMINTFQLGKGFSAEFGGRYASKRAFGVLISDARGVLNAGLLKTFLNKKATIKLNVDDILKSDRLSIHSKSGSIIRHTQAYPGPWGAGSRIYRVTFTRRFGNINFKQRQLKTGIQSEQERAAN